MKRKAKRPIAPINTMPPEQLTPILDYLRRYARMWGEAHEAVADIRCLAATLPLRCVLEQRGEDWAVSKSGALIRREFVDLVFEKVV